VRISFAQCGVVNAFYKPNDYTITMCYELLVDLAQRCFTDAKANELLGGAVNFVSIHELGLQEDLKEVEVQTRKSE
jgi:hypothetical protein